ncbi:MAG TPA: hypothetical protein PKY05_12290 [Fibrobacteria bacterium]|nr:hypothetical protein [Fibrobacteria bacterium]
MIKLRALTLSLFVGAATLLTGCFEDVEAPRIQGLAVNPSAVPMEGSQIQGTVEFDTDKATVSFRISSATTGSVVDASSYFDFSQSAALGSSPATFGRITPRLGAPDGSYTLSVTVTDDDGNSTTERASFQIGAGPRETPFDNNAGDNLRILGAQDNSTDGSFLDVDGFKVFKSGTKTDSEKSTIDLVLFASPNTSTGTLMLLSPKEAAAMGLGGVTSWGAANLNSTVIVKAPGPVNTLEQAMAVIGGSTGEKAEAEVGEVYALKLSNGIYASITFIAIVGNGNAAAATVTILSE